MPIDALSWTRETAAALRETAASAHSLGLASPAELRITGTATALAKQELHKLGIRGMENTKF